MMLPLAGYRAPGDAVLLDADGEISAGAFFARVRELADALPAAPLVINLSESRTAFMLGFAAALVRGQTSLLPSGQADYDWQQLARQYPRASIISDRAIDLPHAFDLTPYLRLSAAPRATHAMPLIAAEFIAAILFTSGSTGQPTIHAKSWGQLTRGAANLAAALGWSQPALHAVVGSVPPQHMFGLESTVMLPWHAGIPVHSQKPLLSADLAIALRQCARPCWWMTTPAHLRPPLQAAIALPNLAGIVASTMSLPVALAAAAEARWQVPVVEIYGSTETGALATRRTAADEWWTPLRGVELQHQADGEATRIRAAGSHIDIPVLLADELRLHPDGRFLWLGRAADVLKIGGKRASLAALNQRISEIPGVDDAVYFVPDAAGDAASHDDAHPPRRLAAFYVSATLSSAQVLAALRARVDAVFLPRPLFQVACLPRNATGKLSHATLTALFAQLRELATAATVVRRATALSQIVPATHPALPGHFPGNPIVPGVVILSKVADAIAGQFPHLVADALLASRFYAPLRPDRPFSVHLALRGECVYFELREDDKSDAAGTRIARGRWACRPRAAKGEGE